MSAHPHLNDGDYLGELASLQVEGRLVGGEAEGAWFFTSFTDDVVAGRVAEYSPEFAEMIVAADCDN